jgi:hypothetical protein
LGCPTIYLSATIGIVNKGTYVHNEDPSFVELFNNLLGRYSDCTDKELGLLLNDDIDQFIEFTFCVIVVCLSSVSTKSRNEEINSECYLSADPFCKEESD